jgi:uncharacterized membrane protein YjjP (DUF1212 family)
MHVFFNVVRQFPQMFRNFIFISVGVVDSSVFKGVDEVVHLADNVKTQTEKYVEFAKGHGYYAEARTQVGTDIIETIAHLAKGVAADFPNVIFFAGQLVFSDESMANRLLHNQTAFLAQKRLVFSGLSMIILPIRAM